MYMKEIERRYTDWSTRRPRAPAAVGTAAALGFVVARLLTAGVDQRNA